jgi:hypothetical protein
MMELLVAFINGMIGGLLAAILIITMSGRTR